MKLNHPNVLRLIDWGQENDVTYLVMEYVDGKSLNECFSEVGMGLEKAMAFIPGRWPTRTAWADGLWFGPQQGGASPVVLPPAWREGF